MDWFDWWVEGGGGGLVLCRWLGGLVGWWVERVGKEKEDCSR